MSPLPQSPQWPWCARGPGRQQSLQSGARRGPARGGVSTGCMACPHRIGPLFVPLGPGLGGQKESHPEIAWLSLHGPLSHSGSPTCLLSKTELPRGTLACVPSDPAMGKRQKGQKGRAGGWGCSRACPYHFAQKDGAACGQGAGEAHHLGPEVLNIQVVLQDHARQDGLQLRDSRTLAGDRPGAEGVESLD